MNFISEGQVYLVRCPKCGRANYALNVVTGICTWCGYNANEDEEYKQTLESDD